MQAEAGSPVVCDVCGFPTVVARKCKRVCLNCGTINGTCSDLGAASTVTSIEQDTIG